MQRRSQRRLLIAATVACVLCAQEIVDPPAALWRNLKRALLAPDGPEYFQMGMQGAILPTLRGRVARLDPPVNPTRIFLIMDDGRVESNAADAALEFEKPLPGSVDYDTVLTFEGVGKSFTQNPFLLTMEVAKENLHGWTGKN